MRSGPRPPWKCTPGFSARLKSCASQFGVDPARVPGALGVQRGKLRLPWALPCETFPPDSMAHVKLHIPGPVEVSEKTLKAFASPMIGHRGQGFKDLYAIIQPQLQSLLYT